jgi:hypothetical protein
MKLKITTLFVLLSAYGFAEQKKIEINVNKDINFEKITAKNGISFSKIKTENLELSKTVGAPEVPVKSYLIVGRPEAIKVEITSLASQTFANTRPQPVQEQDCRCETTKVKSFSYDENLYERSNQKQYRLNYLGDFRGVDVTRLDVYLARYNPNHNETVLQTEVLVDYNSSDFDFRGVDNKAYLIIAPANLVDGVKEFADYKKSKGFDVYIESVQSPANTLENISQLVKKYYNEKNIYFTTLVGDSAQLPMFKVNTTGDVQTPSDLKYFTLGQQQDLIPDVIYSRITGNSVEQVASQLAKSIEFEQRTYQNAAGLRTIVGIASNEGSNPSDKEYVKAIEDKFVSTLNASALFLYQNDSQSNPTTLNKRFDEGAFWLTYLGHGSGTSWPSMKQSYSVQNINLLNNKPAVKPIIIDVACMNGRLEQGYLGTSFLKTQNLTSSNPFGAAAYYGGSVNISWHPPAIMARGIAFEHLTKKFKHLGEALLAGQFYLSSNWSNTADVVDNFEWYHLQGDPTMSVQF